MNEHHLSPDAEMTFAEMQDWHDREQPDCVSYFQLGDPGYRCMRCGWTLLIDSEEETA